MILKNAFEQKTKKPGLKFNPGLALIGLRTTGIQHRRPCSRRSPVYQDLSMRYDWPVKKAIVDFLIRLKRNSKHILSNSLTPGNQNKDIGADSKTYVTGIKLRLRHTMAQASISLTN